MRIFFVILTITGLIFIQSCQDDPSSIGSGLIPDDDKISIDTLNSYEDQIFQNSSFYRDTVLTGTSKFILIGKHSGLESTALLRFLITLPDSVLEPFELDSLNILESWIEMVPVYTLGDSNSVFDYTFHKVNAEWDAVSFNREQLEELKADIDFGTDLKTGSVSESDTIFRTPISPEIVREWFILYAEENYTENYGIYVKPTESTGKLMGFQALTAYNTETIERLYAVVEKPGEFIDTLDFQIGFDVHIVEGDEPVASGTEMILQGGLPMRGKLLFDVSDIPEYSVINSATLTLKFDSLSSVYGTSYSDSIQVSLISDSTSAIPEIDSDYGSSYLFYNEDGYYQGDISIFIQRWNTGVENQGTRIRLTDEERILSTVVIYGSDDPDPAKRPELEIKYSTQK